MHHEPTSPARPSPFALTRAVGLECHESVVRRPTTPRQTSRGLICDSHPHREEFQFGHQTVRLETGEIARQADGAVLVNMDDTVVLVTVVVDKRPGAERDFLPLTVEYQEKTYAAGRIPGGFFGAKVAPVKAKSLPLG